MDDKANNEKELTAEEKGEIEKLYLQGGASAKSIASKLGKGLHIVDAYIKYAQLDIKKVLHRTIKQNGEAKNSNPPAPASGKDNGTPDALDDKTPGDKGGGKGPGGKGPK